MLLQKNPTMVRDGIDDLPEAIDRELKSSASELDSGAIKSIKNDLNSALQESLAVKLN